VAKGKSKEKLTIDRWLLFVSVILTFLLIAVAIFLMLFAGNHLIRAFSSSPEGETHIRFDLEGYQRISDRLNL